MHEGNSMSYLGVSRRCAGQYRRRQQRLADGGGQGDRQARDLHVGGAGCHQTHQDVRLGGQLQTTGEWNSRGTQEEPAYSTYECVFRYLTLVWS